MTKIYSLLAVLLIALMPSEAFAYVGPGAGIALVGSSAVIILAVIFAIVGIFLLPFRFLLRTIKYFRVFRKARLKRLIIIGFDGMDPKITEAMMQAGELPSLKKLAEDGVYSRLGSTIPSMSPVAWSTFQTGVNPGAHNVFDFLTRDKRTYFPGMVSVDTVTKVKRFLWKTQKVSEAVLTRKSKPFWKILGDHGFFNSIIRVPISYPPEPLKGNILSAMCTPDMRGSQGSFMYFSSSEAKLQQSTNGDFVKLVKEGEAWTGYIKGPQIAGKQVQEKFEIKGRYFHLQKEKVQLKEGEFSRWVKVSFNVGNGKKASGIFKLRLESFEPEVCLYVTPVNVDPEEPALPISYPRLFSRWLAKAIGSFGTLGFLEDTWGRNEFALDDRGFIDQLKANQKEREEMLFEVLGRQKRGLCVCVFDGTDRVQHMFWRYRDSNHPAPKENNPEYSRTIENVYQDMDKVVSRVRKDMSSGDELIVMSDHGFGSFRRCVNLNYWLKEQGYLVLKDGKDGKSLYLADVDWSKTKAFALGITGIYINKAGRESQGIVNEADYQMLTKEIAAKLENLEDQGTRAVKQVFLSKNVYKGLYAADAPDLILGYSDGYRVSWESVTGSIEGSDFSDNIKAWSGDHHINPDDVPGVLFSTLKLSADKPTLYDMAPTVLNLFGIKAPSYMEGKSLV